VICSPVSSTPFPFASMKIFQPTRTAPVSFSL
jgi:hypothetical protein